MASGAQPHMLHHISLPVADLERASGLYDAALGALGYIRAWSESDAIGYGLEKGKDKLALKVVPGAEAAGEGFHLAFAAPSRDAVDAFYTAAMANGAADNGPPGLRSHYGPRYYACFVIDRDGHRLEAVHNGP